MAKTAQPAAVVRYEGGSPGSELWGGTQANFLVTEQGEHAHEVAVLLTDVSARYLVEATGSEDSPKFREAAAREAGQAILQGLLSTHAPLAPVVMISRAMLEAEPDVAKKLKKSLAK